ncbi:hypothetical protein CNEO_50020 [Clostridium neonatale]|uniref:Uncharacterized protein n=1 Tax=Clostridium neonatale TaxID=137838 RepID=A0AA86MPX1_9CLOT|nr:hypothetical protein CNEO_50020 [Clostridium neonatale]
MSKDNNKLIGNLNNDKRMILILR